jgi:hypothetical protein
LNCHCSVGGVDMQLNGFQPGESQFSGDSIAATFSEWAAAHRSYGGDYDEGALSAGVQATHAAYLSGFSLNEAFEMGRQAYYASLR